MGGLGALGRSRYGQMAGALAVPVAAGYGINLKTMFLMGLWASLLALAAVVVVGYLLSLYWPAFGTA